MGVCACVRRDVQQLRDRAGRRPHRARSTCTCPAARRVPEMLIDAILKLHAKIMDEPLGRSGPPSSRRPGARSWSPRRSIGKLRPDRDPAGQYRPAAARTELERDRLERERVMTGDAKPGNQSEPPSRRRTRGPGGLRARRTTEFHRRRDSAPAAGSAAGSYRLGGHARRRSRPAPPRTPSPAEPEQASAVAARGSDTSPEGGTRQAATRTRHGMFGVRGSGDTSGFGGLVLHRLRPRPGRAALRRLLRRGRRRTGRRDGRARRSRARSSRSRSTAARSPSTSRRDRLLALLPDAARRRVAALRALLVGVGRRLRRGRRAPAARGLPPDCR